MSTPPSKKLTQSTTIHPLPNPTSPLNTLDAHIKKLTTRIKATNTNNVARVANSHLVSADAKLHPLVNLKTGKPIDRFPDCSRGMGRLSLTLVEAILGALEAGRTGKEDEKRARLRMQIGLRPDPA